MERTNTMIDETHDMNSENAGEHQDASSSTTFVKDSFDRIRNEVHKVIVGQDEVLEQATLSMFCGGHAVVGRVD